MIIRFNRILTILLILLAMIGAFFLPRRNMQLTAQVAGIALDWEKNQMVATFELYDPSEDRSIGEQSKVVSATGDTLEQCIENVKLIYGETLFVHDAATMIIEEKNATILLPKIVEYYRLLKNDQMDLFVFFTPDQKAGAVFEGSGEVLSNALAASAKITKKTQTVKDLMNSDGQRVYVRGEGRYEIVS